MQPTKTHINLEVLKRLPLLFTPIIRKSMMISYNFFEPTITVNYRIFVICPTRMSITFGATDDFSANPYLFFFFCFIFGYDIFRLVETFLMKPKKPNQKYYSRTAFRLMILLKVVLQIFATIIQDDSFSTGYSTIMTTIYQSLNVFAITFITKSYYDFYELTGHGTSWVKRFFLLIAMVFIVATELFLALYVVVLLFSDKGKEAAEITYSIYFVIALIFFLVFVSIPLLLCLYITRKNSFGNDFSRKLLFFIIFQGLAMVYIIFTIGMRCLSTFAEFTSQLMQMTRFLAAGFDLIMGITQDSLDCVLENNTSDDTLSEMPTEELHQSLI